MDKPVPQIIERLDWRDCVKYIEHKYNCSADELWATMCNLGCINNGSNIWLIGTPEDPEENRIQEYFLDEFGEGPYWVEW